MGARDRVKTEIIKADIATENIGSRIEKLEDRTREGVRQIGRERERERKEI